MTALCLSCPVDARRRARVRVTADHLVLATGGKSIPEDWRDWAFLPDRGVSSGTA